MSSFEYDVAIIGSGPSGIAAATALANAGLKNIVVYEREAEIGGIPRHTHHPSFGLLVLKRPISGPNFIKTLVKRCPNVRFETSTTITAIRPGGELDIAAASGNRTIRARHIILATGARETPRHPRLISGSRPMGVMTTGALQQFLYMAKLRPFTRAVIVGTELVSFSALWTLRRAGIKAVAMIEENNRITAYRPATLFARLMGVPIHYNTHVADIGGKEMLNRITIDSPKSGRRDIDCDGLIFSGEFTGENTLSHASHLLHDPQTQLPLVDQNWLSSDPGVSIIGNATHPADMCDQCYLEGLQAGNYVARLLAQKTNRKQGYVSITHGGAIKFTTPNILRPDGDAIDISLHVTKPCTGTVQVTNGDTVLYTNKRRCLPARRITLRNIKVPSSQHGANSEVKVSLTP